MDPKDHKIQEESRLDKRAPRLLQLAPLAVMIDSTSSYQLSVALALLGIAMTVIDTSIDCSSFNRNPDRRIQEGCLVQGAAA